MTSRSFFEGQPEGADVVRFVSVLSKVPRPAPPLPIDFPSSGPWQLRVLVREGRFVVGLHRRHMKAIGYLGTLDRIFGAPVTTRNWNTMTAVAAALAGKRPSLDKNRASSRLRLRRRAPRGEARKKPSSKEDR